jgi:hypothetical protein
MKSHFLLTINQTVMNTDTLDKMRRMRLLGMHRAFKTSFENTGDKPLPPTKWWPFL